MKLITNTVFVRDGGAPFQMIQTFADGSTKTTDISEAAYRQGLEAQRTKKAMTKAALSGVAFSGGVAASEAALGGAAAAAEVAGAAFGAAEVVAAVPTILTIAAIGGIGYGLYRGYKALTK